MKLADIDFSDKKMYYTTNVNTAPPNRISVDEYTYLCRLGGASNEAYTTLAFPYYHKLYAYHDRFDTHMPDSLRLILLQEIEDSI